MACESRSAFTAIDLSAAALVRSNLGVRSAPRMKQDAHLSLTARVMTCARRAWEVGATPMTVCAPTACAARSLHATC